jgi:hypothetical protein
MELVTLQSPTATTFTTRVIIQKFYVPHLRVFYDSQNKQQLFLFTALLDRDCLLRGTNSIV